MAALLLSVEAFVVFRTAAGRNPEAGSTWCSLVVCKQLRLFKLSSHSACLPSVSLLALGFAGQCRRSYCSCGDFLYANRNVMVILCWMHLYGINHSWILLALSFIHFMFLSFMMWMGWNFHGCTEIVCWYYHVAKGGAGDDFVAATLYEIEIW